MADPVQCAADIMAALAAVPGITGYDGFVPVKVPETGGFIDPYVVLWAGTGDEPGELPADGRQTWDTIIWDFQTTAVGATPGICRAVDQAVAAVLTNLAMGTGRVRRNPDGFNQQAPILDTQTTPSRFMLPRQWRLITN
ncbi:hypothetical protein [Arthrobacter sp. B3I4]|uniref:hypothetical protein n=1 Tax=Arthrobacter sp. B3I4 TaxID=3042267 RepID=UPI0027863DBD|nr:hypothetical protein [Arthrobacter sp. B3I4]MDQ0756076.1 hypothetical protein [Arthrobacter sp. B3I4]